MQDISKPQEWIVRWECGKTQRYIPGDSLGMNRFMIQGLQKGKIYINEDEVVGTVTPDGMLSYKLKISKDKKWL